MPPLLTIEDLTGPAFSLAKSDRRAEMASCFS